MPVRNTAQLNATLNLTSGAQIRPFVKVTNSPLEPYEYYGRMTITDAFGNTRAESEIIYAASDVSRNSFTKVGEIPKAIERGTASFTQKVDQDTFNIFDDLLKQDTVFNILLVVGDYQNPQDKDQWRSQYLLSQCKMTELTRGENLNPQDPEENGSFMINGSFTYWETYPIGTVDFSNIASAAVTRDVLSVATQIYGESNNTEVFGITANTATSAPSAVIYGNQANFAGMTQTNIAALGTDGAAGACEIVGNYLLALRTGSTLGHIYSPLDDVRFAADNFTAVSSGYVASKTPSAIYAASAGSIYLSAAGGYVYKLSNVSSAAKPIHAGSLTTENLAAIHGFGRQVVAVGASSAIIYSNSSGSAWSTATAPTTGLSIISVQVIGFNKWFIGTGAGKLYYTENAGRTWTEILLPEAPTSLAKIVFYTAENDAHFGYIIAAKSSGVLVYRTVDGGNTWSLDVPYTRNVAGVFSGESAASDLSVVSQNELVVVAGTIVGYAGLAS